MPQLHFSLDEESTARLRARAAASGQPLSKYIAELVKQQLPRAWPEGYLEQVVGCMKQDPLLEAEELPLTEPDGLL